MDSKKYRYHHIGIPTTQKKEDEQYLPYYDIYLSGYCSGDFNIEWMRCGTNCKLPDIIKNVPHVAFVVDDIYEEIKRHKILLEPTYHSHGVTVAFILENDSPIELLQFSKSYVKLY